LAKGHIAALKHIKHGISIYNLGTGKGVSVLQLIEAFKKASGKDIPYQITDRRPGDVASCYASPDKAKKELGWMAEKTIQEACTDSWRWQSKNPNGYKK
jgi:UDP-glucose 4-epimerase